MDYIDDGGKVFLLKCHFLNAFNHTFLRSSNSLLSFLLFFQFERMHVKNKCILLHIISIIVVYYERKT